MKKNKQQLKDRFVSRRQFLAGGSAFLTLPPLLSLMPSHAAAQIANQRKVRSVIYLNSLGIDPHQIVPQADPAGLITLPNTVYTRYRALNSFSAPFSRMIDSSFASMYPNMNVFKSLSLTGGLYQGHNTGLLAGVHSGDREPTIGKTLDVIMEQSGNVYKNGEYTKVKALRIGSNVQDSFSFDRVSGQRINSKSLLGDTAVFNQLFGGIIQQPPADATLANQKRSNYKLIVDQVYDDLKKLESDRRLSKDDKIILDRYVSSFRDVQTKISSANSGTAPTCSAPSLALDSSTVGNGFQFPYDPAWQIQNTSAVFDNYIEMIKLAFMCDLTRVVIIQNSIWSDLPISPGSDGGLHHECPSTDIAADRQQWGLKKMLKLAQTLQATPDSQGDTLLYNSSVLFTNELGSWTADHNTFSIPAVLFGSGGGAFRTGNYIDYTQLPRTGMFQYDPTNANPSKYSPGRPYKQLLQSIMSSVGVTKAEYMQFGDGKGFGEFTEGINQFGKVLPTAFSAYRNEHNDLLPYLMKV